MSILKPRGPSLTAHVETLRSDEMVTVPSRELVPTTPPPPTLDELTAQIRSAHAEAIGAFAAGAEAAIKAGKALLAAKAARPHGRWLDYVAVDCGLSPSTAQVYMKLARHEPQLRELLAVNSRGSGYLSQAEALRLLSVAHRSRRKRPRRAT